MALGIGSGLWAICQPLDAANIALNPSFEFGNLGVVAIQSATLGTTSQFQRFGAQSLKVTPGANGTSGAMIGTYTVASGTTYSVSVWAFVEQGVPMRFGVGDQNGVNLQASSTVTFTGGGTWQWYATNGLTEVGGATRGVVLQKSSGNSQLSYYVDGLMINPWTDGGDRQITYFDGDTNGGTWTGAQQASTSTRTGQYRGGGSIVALADLGLQVDQMLGVGMPPVENSSQSYAVVDGAQFQRTRAASRHFTLTAKPIVGTSLADFHITRRALIDIFKPDLVGQQQPVHLMYYGGQGTIGIDAYYEKGLELGNMDGVIAENAAISFAAYDPYWYAPTQQGTTLAPRVALGSTNYMLARSPLGKWGTLGASNGTTVHQVASGAIQVNAFDFNAGGTLFFGGHFGSATGTAARSIGMYFPSINTFGSLQGGTAVNNGGEIFAITISPSGSVYLGGDITSIAGTTVNGLAQWNGAFGSLTGGTLSAAGSVNALLYSSLGSLWIGGKYTTIGGTTGVRGLAFYANGVSGTPTGGTIDGGGTQVYALTEMLDQKILFGGDFNLAGGSVARYAGFWNGAFGTLAGGSVNHEVTALATGLNGVGYIGGVFQSLNTGTAAHILQWNQIALQNVGTGLDSNVSALAVNPQTGDVYAGGLFINSGVVSIPSSVGRFNGYAWIPFDLDMTDIHAASGSVHALAFRNNTLYIGGNFNGTAYAASVGTIVNTGRSAVYPNLRLRNLSSGTAKIYQLMNTLTGDGIYFNYRMQANEQVVLTLQPGARSFQSTSFGNILNAILPGSNLATLNLLPGTNYVSFLSDNDSLIADFFWQPRGWSIDSGTI